MEQLKFPGGQLQGTALQADLPGVQIQGEIPVAQRAVLHSSAAPAEDDPDLLQQNGHGEGLCDIVVNVQPESPELLLLPIQGGEHQNRYLGLPSDELTDPETVDLRQHQVQQHQVEGTGLEQFQGCHPVSGRCGPIPRVLEVGAQQLLDIRLILYD